jgi:1,4-dihydroxy-2-naphthoate octaprenyltransferase
MTSPATWWHGARPRTLGAGLVPVVVGTAAAGHVVWWRFAAALVVASGLQIGVNLANDAFDGMKGVDTQERVGPPRLTQTGAASEGGADRGVRLHRHRALAGIALALATAPALILLSAGSRSSRPCCTAAARGPTPASASAR